MKYGIKRKSTTEAVMTRVLIGAAAVGLGMLLVRSLPDLVRYLRAERM